MAAFSPPSAGGATGKLREPAVKKIENAGWVSGHVAAEPY
jgi:hypothetical protein